MPILANSFFDQDACLLAQQLLGKVIRRKYGKFWLAAQIIETEAYYLQDKGSHASLGYTEKRKALFMPAGTIYMYYARGRDSLNVSCMGKGNAVLIKSAFPYIDPLSPAITISTMQQLNPLPSGLLRAKEKLCNGQTLLCTALDLKVPDWDQQSFNPNYFYFDDVNYKVNNIVQASRLGITQGRDENLKYRFIDYDFVTYCSSNPLTKRNPLSWSIIACENSHNKEF
ncbi:MAG: DNA-3-methyladenine glycosylase [Pseudomonadota bacterium]